LLGVTRKKTWSVFVIFFAARLLRGEMSCEAEGFFWLKRLHSKASMSGLGILRVFF
jgi:hypothetical protein